MIAVIGYIRVKPERLEEFELLFSNLKKTVKNKEPGCIVYTIARNRDDPYSYRAIEIFSDQKALDNHLSSEYFQEAFAKIGACTSEEAKVEFLDTVA
jgi:quinol monooxygenase YgiN